MVRRTPFVVDGMIHFPGLHGDPKIGVESASWAAWLSDAATRSFSTWHMPLILLTRSSPLVTS